MMKDEEILKIKDSVDLYTQDNNRLVIYYMNTRQRKIFRVSQNTIKVLELINGRQSLHDIIQLSKENIKIPQKTTMSLITQLYNQRILTPVNFKQNILSEEVAHKYTRQINYFSEFFSDELEGYRSQKRLCNARILIFGCGAIGGNIAVQLAMAGVTHFTLVDPKVISNNSLARHIYFNQKDIGRAKVDALKDYLLRINPGMSIKTYQSSLKPKTDINNMIKSSSFVIDTADEPYIGYTASKISRVCVKKHTPLYIAGGFDAHLASTGEIIIPGITPCADCYADYFKNALKGWKPEKYPEREIPFNEMGGLASMTLFASSFACIEIIKYIAKLVPIEKYFKVRGELLFEDFNLNYLDVKRDPNCSICKGVAYENKD